MDCAEVFVRGRVAVCESDVAEARGRSIAVGELALAVRLASVLKTDFTLQDFIRDSLSFGNWPEVTCQA